MIWVILQLALCTDQQGLITVPTAVNRGVPSICHLTVHTVVNWAQCLQSVTAISVPDRAMIRLSGAGEVEWGRITG